ncbi:ATP-binding cassette domain-containing protein [Salinarimonas rosea]|uniref:ATP-binding cassette domain-containing protein n=1 Tax=Salinarimonas rosea TaxID=552063 RepID=UPI0003FB19E6|nr:ATP-binding cassette domain-containing protein [Salinarimonas rosea]
MNAPAIGIRGDAPPLVEVHDLVRRYRLPRRTLLEPAPTFTALHGVSLTLRPGESLGIVGESGCGKSTLARTVMALETPQEGSVRFRGRDLFALSRAELRAERKHFQAIFQDPYGSLDPRHSVGRIVAEPIRSLEPEVDASTRERRVREALDQVGLPASAAEKYPHEFSGGQRQRIAIARALVTRPALIVCDEPVSALDVSVQAQVLNLMMDLQEQLGLAYLFISHDLSVVRVITDRVCVMQAGRIVEEGVTDAVFDAPSHAYTRTLLDAVPGRHRRTRAAEAARANG